VSKDFDAYLENKWKSRVFNRERLEVREKLLALGRRIAPSVVAADGSPLEYEVSVEHPALWNHHEVQNQHLFFSRNKEARKEIDGIISKNRTMAALIDDPSPLRNHIFLSLMIDLGRIELALKVHSDAAVDRDNLQRKCQDFFQREKLLHLIQNLSEHHTVGIMGQSDYPARTLDDDTLQSLVNALPSADSWLSIGRSYSREDPAVLDLTFADVARDDLRQLLPLLHFISWGRDNDSLAMRATLKLKEVKQKSRGLAKNDRVRVVKGVFSGKTGKIQDVDAKGALKVLLGSMLVKLMGDDVVKM